jgi:hypothetical protein
LARAEVGSPDDSSRQGGGPAMIGLRFGQTFARMPAEKLKQQL